MIDKAPLNEKIWQYIDEGDFSAKFNIKASHKTVFFSSVSDNMVRVAKGLIILLPKLTTFALNGKKIRLFIILMPVASFNFQKSI